jgi:peroxiredoxin
MTDNMKRKTPKLIIACWLVLYSASITYAAQEGTRAPDFRLSDLTGRTIALEQFRGKVVFLDFWAPWCIPCRDELPELDRFYMKFQDEGFIVVGIAVDASPEGVTKFLQKVPVSFPVLLDVKGGAAESYRLVNMPTGYLIGRDGIIRHIYKGYGKDRLLHYETNISDLLKQ